MKLTVLPNELPDKDITPHDIVTTLKGISKEILDATKELAVLDEASVKARVAQKVGYARSFLSVEGPMDLRRYTADLETRISLLESELADQKYRACQQALRALRDRLEVGRSIGALVRMEWGAS